MKPEKNIALDNTSIIGIVLTEPLHQSYLTNSSETEMFMETVGVRPAYWFLVCLK
ncbi:hypothetical protein M8C21_029017 [Ambrosia artemisiifolia]|uniref:Uncharacterized protein n=1 Tax=Ambrosia artemisiifolia TaxID=4212 RepID=A0AAD5CVJ6_AMBAR|nr:hypothetical protein M8C21_029017 [Ambrosia artemisiifolia]